VSARYRFIATRWGRHFAENPSRYAIHPYLAVEVAEWLVDHRAKLIGIDVPTPDLPEPLRRVGFDWLSRHMLPGNGTLIAGHLNRLDSIVGRRFGAFALPLAIVGAEGSPARVASEQEEE
jgi:kynurenine formamidase